ncbi:MAG: hypothetical protein H6617_04945 [Bdellovibrionaceae bacterium]|nr:hypothetical protein [Bdellovibrionales bacterium]MCB9254010.1 hypothetical protein [Pseudobdellovibrionaceae bacterium]
MKSLRTWAEKVSGFIFQKRASGALSAQAAKIAHDIRSPLSALFLLQEDLQELPEEKRLLIQQALTRIQDITNSLLPSPESVPSANIVCAPESPSTQWLLPICERVLAAARSRGLDVVSPAQTTLNAGFVWVPQKPFVAALHSLFGGHLHGPATMRLETNRDQVVIEIQAASVEDNSATRALFASVTEKLECWGGKLELHREPAYTRIWLSVPRAEPPKWFVPRLMLSEKTHVLCLDDDPSVHAIWDSRLQKGSSNKQVHHFGEGKDFAAKSLTLPRTDLLCLVDYELEGQEHNGLELILELGLEKNAILVTGCYDKPSLQADCSRWGVRLLPKPLVASLPIEWAEEHQQETVLIEDDPLVRNMWRLVAKSENQSLKIFEEPGEFFREAHLFSLSNPIYVDVELANGERGEEVSRRIADLGFTNIYLTTGHPKWRFGPLPWIREIIGKAPPWGAKIDGASVAIGQPGS